MHVMLKGVYSKAGNTALYKTARIVTDRIGSTVEVFGDKVILTSDLFGIDKLYYAIEGENIAISNKLKDFYDYSIDDALWPIQLKRGYVPYPFTILKGVRKTLPGISLEISRQEGSRWSYNYNTDKLKNYFNDTIKYDIENFREAFLKAIAKIKSSFNKNAILSLSGGCDSLLLHELFKDHIVRFCHYAETPEDEKRLQKRLGGHLKDIPWSTLYGTDKVDAADIDAYFDSLDEPCFCVTGLAEYLMIKKMVKFTGDISGFYMLDGYGADTHFQNGREYFKEWLLEKILLNKRVGINLNKKVRTDTIIGKALDYIKSTKTRFYDVYTEHFKLPEEHKDEILNVYHVYNNALKIDRSKFYGLIRFFLWSSNEGMERIKATANALNVKFISPSHHFSIIKTAMSLPAKYNVGYSEGKRVLRNLLKEISDVPFISEGFASRELWKNVSQGNTFSDYVGFFSNEWRKHYESKNKRSYSRL